MNRQAPQDADPHPLPLLEVKAGEIIWTRKLTPPPHWDRRAILPTHIKFRTCSALAPMWTHPINEIAVLTQWALSLKVQKHEIVLNFFGLNQNFIWPRSIHEKNLILFFRFLLDFRRSNIFAVNEHTQNKFYFCVVYEILSPKCSLGSSNGIVENIFGITFFIFKLSRGLPIKWRDWCAAPGTSNQGRY